MMSLSLWLSVFLLCSGAITALLFNSQAQRRDRVVKRLELVSSNPLAKKGTHFLPRFQVSQEIRTLLLKSGYRSEMAATYFVLCKGGVMVACFTAWLAAHDFAFEDVLVAESIIVAVAGGLSVEHWIKLRVKRIAGRIARSTPDALDLMVVCVESGLTLEAVFGRVGHEMAKVAPDLSREWLITEAELQLLSSRHQALSNLADRTGIPEIENMVIALAQAEKYGSPIAQTMRLLASDSRQHQYLQLEERVGKIPAKMSLPLVVLVMIPVVVIVVAPTVLELLNTLGEM